MTDNFLGPYDTTITKRAKNLAEISEFTSPLARYQLENLLQNIILENSVLQKRIELLEDRIHSLENVIQPDQEDVYNINRRIEILAQKIAMLESNE